MTLTMCLVILTGNILIISSYIDQCMPRKYVEENDTGWDSVPYLEQLILVFVNLFNTKESLYQGEKAIHGANR